MQEFCWATWLAGLVYAWTCVFTGCIQAVLTARSEKTFYEAHLPVLRSVPPIFFLMGMIILALLAGLTGFYLYSYLFGFYGLFLSFFAEMEPVSMFGRDGFINSDFYSPVKYLAYLLWPMVLGTLIANWRDFFGSEPWKRILLPIRKEVLRMHLLIVLMPFLTLIAWALFGEKYHAITIILLMAIFYMLPGKPSENKPDRLLK